MMNDGVNAATNSARRIAFLDHLRIFAFSSVLIGHTLYAPLQDIAENPALHITWRWMISLVLPLVQHGGAGVVVFFLVSGYIITFVLRAEYPVEFAIKRIFRIYPLYVVAVLLEASLLWMGSGTLDFGLLAMQLTLLGDWSHTPYALAGVEWTLRIEVLFYAFMGSSAWLYRRFGASLEKAGPASFLVVTMLLTLCPPITDGSIGWGNWPATGVINLYFPFLLIGAMVFIHERQAIGHWQLASFVALVLANFYWHTPIYQPLWKDDHHAIIALGIFFIAWHFRALMITTPLVRQLSDLTYPVYLFHNWLYVMLLDQLIQRTEWPVALCTSLSFVLLFGFCSLAFRFVEQPFIRYGRRIAGQVNLKGANSTSSRSPIPPEAGH